ncbi:MAG: hypothetical protein EOM05_00200 [Clostridia bacterium]|nr:hypothetical protein [Clostridia bacterium]
MADIRGCGCNQPIKEAVCIDTKRIYDSCADKDCISGIQVCFTDCEQAKVNCANSIRCRGCDVTNCFIDVEEVPFNRGFYSVDITFFIKVRLDAYTCSITPSVPVEGLVIFTKKAILYGSDGRVKTFSSEFSPDEFDEQLIPTTTNPIAKVQCVDPICLDAKLCRPCDCCELPAQSISNIPGCVCRQFAGSFTHSQCEKSVRVTLGLFSIVQLERDVQIMIPSYDFCVPTKECNNDKDDPCSSFKKIKFPLDEFFPPEPGEFNDDGPDIIGCCGCGG